MHGFNSIHSLGAAVSGGADSTALLVSLAHLCRKYGVKLYVITVNHHIRPSAETDGDARFVFDTVISLAQQGMDVECRICSLPEGEVGREADKRGRGIEEAARYLRYKAFEDFAVETGVPFICLAHNCNDQLETLLMRFLQGSGGMASAGMQRSRGIFLRPLLDISRSDIEKYLVLQNLTWCTDKTNCDTRYLRNRMRGKLIPFLDSLVPGWQHSVLAGAEKARDDASVLDFEADKIRWKNIRKNRVTMEYNEFCMMSKALRRRALYHAFEIIGSEERIPYSFVRSVCSWPEECISSKVISAAGIQTGYADNTIFVEKVHNDATECGFFVIIDRTGDYELSFCTITVTEDAVAFQTADGCGAVYKNSGFPFCVRSRQPGDRVKTASGGMKLLNDVFSSWHTGEKFRDSIPVIQELYTPEQKIVCICGSIFGYEDWIVK